MSDVARQITEATEDAQQSVAAARRAAGEPWQDDSGRDIHWLRNEAEAIRDRFLARIAYDNWKRKRPLIWRWLTYPAAADK